MRMKVLQINCVYPSGSTGKIVQEIHHALLNAGHKSLVFYGRGSKSQDEHALKICSDGYAKWNHFLSMVNGLMYGGCFLSTAKIIHLIKKENPDIVHLHCINGYFVNIYRLIAWLNSHHIKTVITHHAEFMYTGNCSYAMDCDRWRAGCGQCPRRKEATKSLVFDRTAASFTKMEKSFQQFDELMNVSVSGWVDKRLSTSSIMKERDHRIILNGIHTECFKVRNRDEIRKTLGYGKQKILFHVTSFFTDAPGHIKGGWALIELAKRLEKDGILILVACSSQKICCQLPSNVIVLGKIADQNLLADYYSMANCSVIVSYKETFSMPCAESLCAGTPVVGFEAGAPEEISLDAYSEFVEYGNVAQLEKAVRKWLCLDIDQNQIGESAKSVYSSDRMCNEYIQLYGEML